MKIGIGAKLTTGMTLTPQMQQAIRLLQLSSLELEQEVQLKLDSNPLLEREEEWETSYEDDDNLPDGENYPEQDLDNDYDDDYQVEGVALSEADLDDYTRHETESASILPNFSRQRPVARSFVFASPQAQCLLAPSPRFQFDKMTTWYQNFEIAHHLIT